LGSQAKEVLLADVRRNPRSFKPISQYSPTILFPFVFSLQEEIKLAHLLLLLLKAGDIEKNPGPEIWQCPICTKIVRRDSIKCINCHNWIHRQCSPFQRLPPTNHNWKCQICTPPTILNPINQNSHISTLNILQININGIHNNHKELETFLHKHNIHIALIQEAHFPTNLLPPTFYKYDSIYSQHTPNHHKLLTLIHNSINYSNTSSQYANTQNDNTSKIQTFSVEINKNTHNFVNLYIPHHTSKYCPSNYSPNLTTIKNLPNLLLCGDFNAHHRTWYKNQTSDKRGIHIIEHLEHLNILNNKNLHTRTPTQTNQTPTSPDITLCSPNIHPHLQWTTKTDLNSDHLPIIIKYHIKNKPTHKSKTTFTNYKKADWTGFSNYIDENLTTNEITNISSLKSAIQHLTHTIQKAANIYIPKGHIKKYEPNLSPEITSLIKQRNALKRQNNPTQLTKTQLETLNNQISTLIKTHTTNNYQNFLIKNLDNTNSKRVWKTIHTIHNAKNNSLHTHETPTNPTTQTPLTPKQHINLLATHFAKQSSLPTHPQNRKIIRKLKQLRNNQNNLNAITPTNTQNTIKTIKNSPATGPDNISNIHLKHLSIHTISYLTSIFNKSIQLNYIPPQWKKALIIPKLKPGKDPSNPSSYRPISLLSTISKLLEKLILNSILQYIPQQNFQHGFKPNHSTTTALTNIIQPIINGLNHTPYHKTILIAIDINKAFDTVPRHNLIHKILQSNIPTNTKKWLANFLSGRTAQIQQNGHKSRTINIRNGVPQGAILSPTLFNLYTADLPQPQTPFTRITSYADDLTIATTHKNLATATSITQDYLTQIQTWLVENRMTASPNKSSITLITTDKQISNTHPQVLLNNIPIPFNKTPKILGLTLDPYLNFSKHIQNTTSAANRKLNILKTVANTDIHNNIQTSIAIYKQFIRPTINYASPVWHPLLSDHNLTTLQTTQNKALRTITGCTHSTPQQHLHNETKILPIRNHLEMIGTQFYAKTRLPTHPCHKTLLQPTPQRLKQPPSSTGALYKQILNHIPPPPPNTTTTKHIHTQLTHSYMTNRPPNNILNEPPPEINPDFNNLPRHLQISLARLRCGHHPNLQHYKHRFEINQTVSPTCTRCGMALENVEHFLLNCPSNYRPRRHWGITSLKDLWTRPTAAGSFISDVWPPQQGVVRG
jgi:hypothetical protein